MRLRARWPTEQVRSERRYSKPKPKDFRTYGERDRDRVIYSSAFRRLGGVTQVVWAAEEGHLLHNRLTHSLKVAQVARRIAEKFQRGFDVESGTRPERLGGLDPSVVEAAALAHDLGHPPFGHIAEEVLNRCAIREKATDGFEGNAQTFRICTRLGVIREEWSGLDLSRATLSAVLKYPWRSADRKHWGDDEKFGVYDSDQTEFAWARRKSGLPDGQRPLEADIMDWADDLTYAVHDVEDFYRAGLIPTSQLAREGDQDVDNLYQLVRARWETKFGDPPDDADLAKAAHLAFEMLPRIQPFRGNRAGRGALRQGTSALINRFILGTRLTRRGLTVERPLAIEVSLLKQLTWHFVIRNAALATQQVGQRRVIEQLFQIYMDAFDRGEIEIFPSWVNTEELGSGDRPNAVRTVVDVVSGMTEAQAVKLHKRLTGTDFGQFLDPAVT